MGRIGLAFRLFFKTLGNREFAQHAREMLAGPVQPALGAPPAAPPPVQPSRQPVASRPLRNDAINLLSVLQREGRLVDFLKEDLSGYNDAQIGAAVRDIHRDCASVLERLFSIRPLRGEGEGTPIGVPAGFDASKIRLTGNVAGSGPYRGTLRHAGWKAQKVELPEWSGTRDAADVIAPAEVEL